MTHNHESLSRQTPPSKNKDTYSTTQCSLILSLALPPFLILQADKKVRDIDWWVIMAIPLNVLMLELDQFEIPGPQYEPYYSKCLNEELISNYADLFGIQGVT